MKRIATCLFLFSSLLSTSGMAQSGKDTTQLRRNYIIDEVVKPSGCEYKEVRTMDEVLPELDVLYMTRVQRERFFNEEDYIRLKDSFILDAEKMKLAPKDLIVLHPLPRINEIAVEVDDDPRAKYFVQAQNSVYVRMALILMLLNIEPGLFEEETVC